MGGDGGVVANSRQFVRGIKQADSAAESVDQREKQTRRSVSCAQSSKTLNEPIVLCQLGNLYNKEDMLCALIDKTLSSGLAHIRGRKDLKEIKLSPNPAYSAEEAGHVCKYVCPLTGQDFNGVSPFVCIWPTGHVISEKALCELGAEALQAEYGPFTKDDLVNILPLPQSEALAANIKLMEARREQGKRDKAPKDEKKRKRSADSVAVAEAKESERASGSIATVTHLKQSANVVKTALSAVRSQEQGSDSFKKLFHKDSDQKTKSADDLMMRIAGARYTL
jgi:hypothetical protein